MYRPQSKPELVDANFWGCAHWSIGNAVPPIPTNFVDGLLSSQTIRLESKLFVPSQPWFPIVQFARELDRTSQFAKKDFSKAFVKDVHPALHVAQAAPHSIVHRDVSTASNLFS